MQDKDIAGAIALAIGWLHSSQSPRAAISPRGLWLPGQREIAGRRMTIEFTPWCAYGYTAVCFKLFDYDDVRPFETGFSPELKAACTKVVCDAIQEAGEGSIRATQCGNRGTRTFSVVLDMKAGRGVERLLKNYYKGCTAHGDPDCGECSGWLADKYRYAALPAPWK